MSLKTANCEVCEAVNVPVYRMPGNIEMCESCKASEEAATQRSVEAINLITESKKIDSLIELKSDVFNAATVSAPELRAAIENNQDIPANMKDFEFAKQCFERFKHMQQVIFQQRVELQEKEAEMRVWQANVQTAAGKLREEYKAQFKAIDIAYQPQTPTIKKIKSAATSGKGNKPGTKTFNKKACDEAAAKYGVPAFGVQSMAVSRNLSYEDAAKELKSLMVKTAPQTQNQTAN